MIIRHSIQVSIIITVFSETSALQATIFRLLQNNRNYIHEIIIVIARASSQECFQIAANLAVKHSLIKVHLQSYGPGAGLAVREGMALATGTYIAIMSADLETEPETIDVMVRKIEQTGCDMVIANRWMKPGGFRGYQPLKLILNWCFQQIFKRVFNTFLGDLTYGFKIIKKEVVRSIKWEGVMHEIFIETTLKPLQNGCHIEQVPTLWIGRRQGRSQNSFLKNLRYVKLAVKLKLTSFKKKG